MSRTFRESIISLQTEWNFWRFSLVTCSHRNKNIAIFLKADLSKKNSNPKGQS
jgi:hypothetical protein